MILDLFENEKSDSLLRMKLPDPLSPPRFQKKIVSKDNAETIRLQIARWFFGYETILIASEAVRIVFFSQKPDYFLRRRTRVRPRESTKIHKFSQDKAFSPLLMFFLN